jgi:hypothetical protein
MAQQDDDAARAALEARVKDALPYYGAPELAAVQFAEVYAELMAVAAARAKWLGELLAAQLAEHGYSGLVGHRYGIDPQGGEVELVEDVRALVKLEAAERDRAERLAREGIKLGIEAKRLDVLRGYARTIGEVLKTMSIEMGLSWEDPAVRRMAQRAVLAARQNLGYSFTSPDAAGPRLSSFERARALETGGPAEPVADPAVQP